MTSVSDPLVGHVLGGRYEILTKLARGGMATVYRARDQRLARTVAVKVMRSDLGEDPEFVAKFDREARAAATLSHPNVVGVFDQGTENGRPYIVMEYVEGHTMRFNVAREAPMPPQRVLDLLEPVVAALAAAHEAGLVHRDIKPENVLISQRGHIKVADFGLARLVTSQALTQTGVLVGTASYLPPELVTKSRPDARSDVYSTGVMAYEMLTGRKPHTGENNYQIAYAHVNVDIPAPSKTLADAGVRLSWHIPDYLDAFVLACTRREPSLRPKDGREMLKWLRRIRKSLEAGLSDDPALAASLSSADSIPTESFGPITPSRAPSNMRPAPTAVSKVWTPRSSAGTPTSSNTPVEHTGPSPMLAPGIVKVPPPPRQARPRVRRPRGALLLVGVLVTALMVGIGSWWLTIGRFTTVPALVNQNQTSAAALAEEQGVNVTFESEYSETVALGLVIRTDPGAGDRVARGGTVTAWLSLGPERYAMPPIAGLSKEDAQTSLRKASLEVGKVTEAYSDTVAAGNVISASQEKGALLKKGTPIDLVVSKGPEPITIPDFTGKEATPSIAALEKLGFVVKSTEANHKTIPAGSLVSQTPNTGAGKRGDTITVVVSKGPVMVKIPAVRSMTSADAKRRLEQAGFVVSIRYSNVPFRLGLAAGTTPNTGELAPEGSTVILHVV